jgi:hypothetical protein
MAAQRARVSALLTIDILHRLRITNIAQIKSYFLCFVQAQFYGLEFLPPAILTHIDQVQNTFMRSLFKLPPGTRSELFYVLFPAYSAVILCLKRRLSFFQRCLRHTLPCVTSSVLVDAMDLYPVSCGWMHESFLLYKAVDPNAKHTKFDFLSDLSSLQEIVAPEA